MESSALEELPGAAAFFGSAAPFFRAGDQFNLLHRNFLAGDDMGMATPVIAADRLLNRTAARLHCIRARGTAGPGRPPSQHERKQPWTK
jgi:hypothetical protein